MGSVEEVSNETSGLECQRLQSEGTQHHNPYQCSTGRNKQVKLRKYGCIHCPKVYTKSSHLRQHQGQKHPIEFVSQEFQMRTLLEIQHACAVCRNPFKSMRLLKVHHRFVHLRHEVVCNICKVTFFDGRSLRSHKETHFQIENTQLSHTIYIFDLHAWQQMIIRPARAFQYNATKFSKISVQFTLAYQL